MTNATSAADSSRLRDPEIPGLHASFVMSAYPLPRHERWRLAYRENRYARHLTQAELNRRIRDIVLNLLRLTPEAKVGLPPMGPVGIRWMVLWTHVLEEMRLRHGPYPNGFARSILHTEPYPDFAGKLAQKAASVLAPRSLSADGVFIKYGRPEHMAALLKHGALRVQPASFYLKADHNGAMRDDERSLQVSLSLNREDIIKVVKNPQDVPPAMTSQRMDFRFQHRTDYWLYCVTLSVEPRLFVDFAATACVIIKDRREFVRRLRASDARHFARTAIHEGQATYVDPLLPSTAKIFLPMSKHFRYAYQEEYRFVWEPFERQDALSHVDVQLGPLMDIAELIVL